MDADGEGGKAKPQQAEGFILPAGTAQIVTNY